MSIGRLLRSSYHDQGPSGYVGEREECLGPGGVWEQGPRDASDGVTDSLSNRRDERDRQGWGDGDIRGG
jgi:hypothetical protein